MKKIVALALAVVMVIGLLAGCEKPMDAQTLTQKMDEAMKAQTAMGGKMNMDMDMTMAVSGMSLEMGIDAEVDMKATMDAGSAYMDMTMGMEVLGQTESFDMEMYMATEDGNIVVYTHSGIDDSWLREESAPVEDLDTASMELSAIPAENLSLAEEKALIGEKEYYVLTANCTGEYFKETMGTAMESAMAELDEESKAMLEGIDWSVLSATMVYHVDPETFLPVQMEGELLGLGDMMSGMMAGMLAEAMLGTGMEEMELTIDIPTCKMSMTELTYGDVEIPAVPQEGIEAAAMNPLQADGSYVLRMNEDAVRVVLPEGFTAYSVESEMLMALTEDYMTSAVYALDAEMTGEDLKLELEAEATYAQDGEYYSSHGAGEQVNGFETMYLHYNDGTSLYYAWRELDTCTLYVVVNAETTNDSLNALLTAVADYEG